MAIKQFTGQRSPDRVSHQRFLRVLGAAAHLRVILAAAAASPLLAAAAPGLAQDQASPSAMVNLIRLLVKQGVITEKAGEALLKQAEAEASEACAHDKTVAALALPVPARGFSPSPAVTFERPTEPGMDQ